jgi:hypothetical protein
MRGPKSSIAGLFLLLLLSLYGCGGGGGKGSSAIAFQGNYQGTWIQTSLTGETLEEGAAVLAIQESGKVSGTFTETGRSGTVQGQIESNGAISFTVTYSDGVQTFNGALTLVGEKLTGSFGAQNALYAGHMPTFSLVRFTL